MLIIFWVLVLWVWLVEKWNLLLICNLMCLLVNLVMWIFGFCRLLSRVMKWLCLVVSLCISLVWVWCLLGVLWEKLRWVMLILVRISCFSIFGELLVGLRVVMILVW